MRLIFDVEAVVGWTDASHHMHHRALNRLWAIGWRWRICKAPTNFCKQLQHEVGATRSVDVKVLYDLASSLSGFERRVEAGRNQNSSRSSVSCVLAGSVDGFSVRSLLTLNLQLVETLFQL